MRDVRGNLWDYDADARVITTNGTIKSNGCAVMGRGCAKEAKKKFPGLDRQLGLLIRLHGGNKVHLFEVDDEDSPLLAFPVKYNWWERADLDLIRRSAEQLAEITTWAGWHTVVLPRPGCGNGGLNWDNDVQPLLAPLLDDRFHVITF